MNPSPKSLLCTDLAALYTPRRRNRHGWLTVTPEELSAAYDKLNPKETADRIEHYRVNNITPDPEDEVSAFRNWLHTYDECDSHPKPVKGWRSALATTNWMGKVTAALFEALDVKQPRTLPAMRAVLSEPDRHAAFNHCPHLSVDVPDGWFTITARTSEGKRITFAFCPYRDGGMAQCVDVQYHDSPAPKITNGDAQIPVMHAVGFTTGSNTFDTRSLGKPTTLVSILLADQDYKPKGKKGCSLDTDGDGNCPVHPEGCPEK